MNNIAWGEDLTGKRIVKKMKARFAKTALSAALTALSHTAPSSAQELSDNDAIKMMLGGTLTLKYVQEMEAKCTKPDGKYDGGCLVATGVWMSVLTTKALGGDVKTCMEVANLALPDESKETKNALCLKPKF